MGRHPRLVQQGPDARVARETGIPKSVAHGKGFDAPAVLDDIHNGVVSGALLPDPGKPARFLPVAASLYFRKSQLPDRQKGDPIEFKTKCEMLVALLRRHREGIARLLAEWLGNEGKAGVEGRGRIGM